MPVVLLRFSETDKSNTHRPQFCNHCGSSVLQRWGRVERTIQDVSHFSAEVYRYRCGDCGRTFRFYPKGIDRTGQSLRLKYLAAVSWALGLSYRDVANFLGKKGIAISHTTVWRDGQELLTQMKNQKDSQSHRKYNIDTIFLPHVSPRLGVVIAVDMGDGEFEVLGTIDEFNPRNVRSWLEPLVKNVDIEVLQLGTRELVSR